MLRIALAFCAGSAALHALPALPPAPGLAGWIPALLLARGGRTAAAALVAGFLVTHGFALEATAAGWPCSRDREEATLTGTVAAPAVPRGGRVDFDLDADPFPGAPEGFRRVRIAWYEADALPRPGERWRVAVRLRCRRGFANPGASDRELDLLRQRIDATAYVVAKSPPLRLAPGAGRRIEHLRWRIARAIGGAVPQPASAAVLQGLAVGVRGSIPDALWDAFAATGVAHLMAISGVHVTGCALAVLTLVRCAWRLPGLARVRRRLAVESALVVATTGAYAVLAGASLPALRTFAMVTACAVLRHLRRLLPVHALLALAVLVLVATDPLALVTPGFWLSVVATAALLAVLADGQGWRGQVAAFARTQGAVTALIAPVLASSFGRLSLVSPVANAIAIPAFTFVVLPAVLLATVVEAFVPGAAAALWRVLGAVLERCWPALEAAAAWPGAAWSPAASPSVVIATTLAAVLTALLVPVTGLRCAAAALLASIALGSAARPAAPGWSLTAVDVGQGLAAVVETARHVLVFDTGPAWRDGGAAAAVTLVPYLRSRGIRRIDLVVLSHDDADHTGGATTLAGRFDVRRTMAGPGGRTRADAGCERGRRWRWDGVEFRVLHPPAGFAGGDNDRSCAILVTGPGGRALLLADPEASAEALLARETIASDVVLVPHHGSKSSSSPALVAAAGARLAIASAGFGNRWGMPAPAVVSRWRGAGATVLATRDEGAIRVAFPARAGEIEVATLRRDRRRWWRAPGP